MLMLHELRDARPTFEHPQRQTAQVPAVTCCMAVLSLLMTDARVSSYTFHSCT
jgi:hypothetical protein